MASLLSIKAGHQIAGHFAAEIQHALALRSFGIRASFNRRRTALNGFKCREMASAWRRHNGSGSVPRLLVNRPRIRLNRHQAAKPQATRGAWRPHIYK